ncbi:alpha/beta fold hydrolase [Nguyenibacter vanlangensis]|uniref:alpha/beta fold hydrolase n=1 Tax=Nguyenibacter vanlangensis TaxID=1216886 RepID=UPI001C400C8E
MATLTTCGGTGLYYKNWGTGQPVLFSHGWPLSADMWDAQMLFLAERGFRGIAFDRRGFDRSSLLLLGAVRPFYEDVGPSGRSREGRVRGYSTHRTCSC